jgi:hypothetical protein
VGSHVEMGENCENQFRKIVIKTMLMFIYAALFLFVIISIKSDVN